MSYENPFETALYSLREVLTEAEDKLSELDLVKDEVSNAINEVDDFKSNIESAIDALESIGELEMSFSFSTELEDIDLSVSL